MDRAFYFAINIIKINTLLIVFSRVYSLSYKQSLLHFGSLQSALFSFLQHMDFLRLEILYVYIILISENHRLYRHFPAFHMLLLFIPVPCIIVQVLVFSWDHSRKNNSDIFLPFHNSLFASRIRTENLPHGAGFFHPCHLVLFRTRN